MARPQLAAPNFQLAQRAGIYCVQWYAGGKRHAVSARTKDGQEARRFLNDFIAGFAEPEPPAEPTISDILDGYLADRKPRVRAYATLEAACAALRRHLGDLAPGSLSRERGRLYAEQRRAEGHMVGPAARRVRKPTADGTIIREIVTLRAALRWAVQEKWIATEPYVPSPAQPAPRDRWLSRDEFERLLGAAQAPHVRLFLLLALHTGSRSGALLELQWDCVDLPRRVIRLGTGIGNKLRATVPINDELHDALVEARAGATCPYVIEFAGGRVLSVKTGFNATVRRAGLGTDVTPHILRHTAATWMAEDGVPMAEISRYLGHKSEKITESVYAKHSPEYLRRAASSLTRRAK